MLQSNKANKIISVIAAIVIWAFVMTAINPTITKTIRDIPVTFQNVSDLTSRNLAVSNGENLSVDVVIEGERTEVSDVERDEIQVIANVSGYNLGLNTVRLNVVASDDIKRVEARPGTVSIMVEDLVSVSKPVELNYDGEFEDGTEAGNVALSPEQIDISGPKSAVENVDKVQATLEADKVMEQKKTYQVEAVPLDTNGEKVDGVTLSQDTVEVDVQLFHAKTIPLSVSIEGEISEEYQVDKMDVPRSVVIKGTKDDIEDISRVTAEAINISDVDVTTSIPIEISLPEGVELADDSDGISIEIKLNGISKKSYKYRGASLEIDGLAAGYTAYVSTDLVEVTVYGEDSVIEGFKKKDIKLFVDMTDVSMHSEVLVLPVEYRCDKDISKMDISPETVRVVLTKEE